MQQLHLFQQQLQALHLQSLLQQQLQLPVLHPSELVEFLG